LSTALRGGFDPPKAGPPRKLGAAFDEYARWCEANRPNVAKKRRYAHVGVSNMRDAMASLPLPPALVLPVAPEPTVTENARASAGRSGSV